MRISANTTLVFVMLSAQTAAVSWLSVAERPPAMANLSAFPVKLETWTKSGEDAIDPASLEQLGADRTLSWNYLDSRTGKLANVFVAWFQSQRGGATQPHSPRVCLPGNGWTSEDLPSVSVVTPGGAAIPVNRLLVSKADRRAIVYYWYQTPRRVVASEWAAKLWLIPDSIRDRRTDTSLVRVTVWESNPQNEVAADFSGRVSAVLRGLLPR